MTTIIDGVRIIKIGRLTKNPTPMLQCDDFLKLEEIAAWANKFNTNVAYYYERSEGKPRISAWIVPGHKENSD